MYCTIYPDCIPLCPFFQALFAACRTVLTAGAYTIYDDLWKAVAASLSLALAYILRVYLPMSDAQSLGFDLVAFLVVLSMALDGFLYNECNMELEAELAENPEGADSKV
eukprot:GHVU01013165.1.p5 GENE.GHVU01013165.1~~GHVU01013165.1.p5  ORF type:complete len:109 (-),score=4.99 GHVU01013165.1:2370-2696(-)